MEFTRGHTDSALIFCIGDSEGFRVNVHKFQFKVSDSILFGRLEHEREGICGIFGFECDDIFVSGALQDFAHIGRVESEADGTITTEVVEAAGLEVHLYEGNVGGVHGLDGEFVFGAVNVCVLYEVLQGFDELLEYAAVENSCFEHGGLLIVAG